MEWNSALDKFSQPEQEQVFSPEMNFQDDKSTNIDEIQEEGHDDPEGVKKVNSPTKNVIAILILLCNNLRVHC